MILILLSGSTIDLYNENFALITLLLAVSLNAICLENHEVQCPSLRYGLVLFDV